jgi:tetratricopeptide (TPR) repeat protein
MVFGRRGKILTVCDGYWIITFGQFGAVGIASLIAAVLLPVVLTIRRHPASTWSRPEVAPAAALAMMLVLIMIDELSNGMLNPIYAMIIGGLSGLPAGSRRGRLQEAEDSLVDAVALADDGHPAEAEQALLEAVAARELIARGMPGPDGDRRLALARGQLGRALAAIGRADEATVERRRALDLWERLAARSPGDPELRGHRADALNDLAWIMVAEPEAGPGDPGQAVRLAEEAVRLAPDLGAFWNTLGVARYRAGDWAGAVEALERSIAAGPPGGTAFDHFFLAMALQRLGEPGRARASFERAVDWADRHRPGHAGLARYRGEAVALMGRPGRAAAEVP